MIQPETDKQKCEVECHRGGAILRASDIWGLLLRLKIAEGVDRSKAPALHLDLRATAFVLQRQAIGPVKYKQPKHSTPVKLIHQSI